MPRNMHPHENRNRAKAKRDCALARTEFRVPSEPRIAAAGATSFPIKAEDPAVRRMIDEAIAKRRAQG